MNTSTNTKSANSANDSILLNNNTSTDKNYKTKIFSGCKVNSKDSTEAEIGENSKVEYNPNSNLRISENPKIVIEEHSGAETGTAMNFSNMGNAELRTNFKSRVKTKNGCKHLINDQPRQANYGIKADLSIDKSLKLRMKLVKKEESVSSSLSLFQTHLSDHFLDPMFYAPPLYTRNNSPTILSSEEYDSTPLYGYALLTGTVMFLVVFVYALVISKLLPSTGYFFLDKIKKDDYYVLLVPMSSLFTIFFVFANWVGMKYFRHN
ncbi:hypothetical protein BB561_005144 [Smittium simulii]|uniref:Uncharacterized protein n=1 Tax=Smittium simulii TaxID=133385 RepID=A0A2T9YBZ0_9FUNG|nr:hypothetical protein BB561_005144 [Smittium simulii]